MNDPRPLPEPSRLPTLTEVVLEGLATPAEPAAPLPPPLGEAAIVDAVIAALQPRIDLMFEYRLRETLAPLLAQAADALVNDARQAMAGTLRDVVARAVNQELSRRRPR